MQVVEQVTLGLIQMSMSKERDANLSKALSLIEKAAKKGAQIVCLPELFYADYFPQTETKEPFSFAESIPGKITELLAKVARDNKIVLVGGSIFEKDGKKFYNTSIVFDETGKLIGKYRKMHIPHDPNFYEQTYFAKGDMGFQVFKTKYGNISVPICYDQWFPEAARIMAMMGADIIFYPTAIGVIDGNPQKFGSWQDAWETIQRSHAIANGVVVAAVNRVGTEGNLHFWGGSFVCNQFGKVVAKAGNKEEIILATVDIASGKEIRDDWRFVYERRNDAYKPLLEKWGRKE